MSQPIFSWFFSNRNFFCWSDLTYYYNSYHINKKSNNTNQMESIKYLDDESINW